MNNLLAIETSGEACSVALSMHGEIRQKHVHAPMKHAELLLPAVHSLLDEADTRLNELDAIVFGRGPGSFTSLRIGIGVVQGLAWGAEIPVIPISSLAVVAQQTLVSHQNSWNVLPRFILVAMDARMSEVFHCMFEFDKAGLLAPATPESVSSPGKLLVPEPDLVVGAGNGFERYPALLELSRTLSSTHEDVLPTGTALIQLAQHWLETNEPLSAGEAQPVYIRDNVAEKPVK
jgi:tRNA threonylcarbamoyladenosine biosynthesis protein TsaB